jgi:hypothetical protein
MGAAAIGIIALLIVLWTLNSFAKSNPKVLALIVRKAGGIIAILGAGFLALRGEFALAVPVGAAGLGMLGWNPLRDTLFGGGGAMSGRSSRVRAPYVEMTLDHDTGRMTGIILRGQFKDTALDAMDVSTLVGLFSEVDQESAALLAAYLDRRNPRWRENANGGGAAGQGHPAGTGKMTEQEAQQILGVTPGATTNDITAAHRRLMKKLHPDQGGSTYLAARVNEAKEVLLRRH